MILKVTKNCNLSCKNCFMFKKGDKGYLSQPNIIAWSDIEKIPDMIYSVCELIDSKRFYICYHGGEPLLIGKKYFTKIADFFHSKFKTLDVRYSLQTNAILIDNEWIDIFNKYNISVAASLNGPPKINQEERIYSNGKDSTQDAVNGIKLLREKYSGFSGVLCVINPEFEPSEIIEYFYSDLKLEWFDFLLPDFTYDDLPANWDTFQNKTLKFLQGAFSYWYNYSDKLSCSFFDTIVGLLAGYKSNYETIGMEGVYSISVETDGSIEPHDVTRICKNFNRKTNIKVGKNAYQMFAETDIYKITSNQDNIVASKCQVCDEYEICKGGFIIHRYSSKNGFNNPTVYCFVYYNFIKYVKIFLGQRFSDDKKN